MTDEINPFDRLQLQHERTLFLLHGWLHAADGSAGGDYFKLAHSLSEAIDDLEANDCSADLGGYLVRDAFLVLEGDQPEIHVELVGLADVLEEDER